MEIAQKVAIVTGAGRGIGAAIAQQFAREGARVLLADLDGNAARAAADEIAAQYRGAAIGVGADVADSTQIERLIRRAETEFGPVDMYFANAGVMGPLGLDVDDDVWDSVFDVNVWAHIRAARLLVPKWLERGEGYFVSTASAAGLLTMVGSATYAVTKHAAVGFAEWLSVTYGGRGIRVSCVCPLAVNTDMYQASEDAGDVLGAAASTTDDVLEAADVADSVLAGLREERFLILPHPQVREMYRRKASDHDRWLGGMRRYQAALVDGGEAIR